ncbi:hypothetical protein [Micrococcoides hystricis]|uniref:DUF3153 domain-containing protein n=1 Tax=Micrococcoides hystricis TaxID=1572761 RepID=A0ABV6PAX2_9MICC
MTTQPSHSHPKGLKRFLALLLLPALLFLTACEISMHTKFHENNTAEMRSEMKFTEQETSLLKMSGEEVTCEELMKDTTSSSNPDVEVSYEDLSTDKELHCVASIPPQPLKETFPDDDSGSITNENGVYTLTIPSEEFGENSPEAAAFADAVTFAAVFEFPGDVIEASAGTVEGNKVTISKLSDLQNDVTIKAHSTTGGVGSSIMMWVLIGLVALLLIGLILWLVLRGKKGNQEHPPAGPGYPGNYGQPGPQQPGHRPEGFQPQPGHQPGQQGYGHPGQQPPAQQGNPQGYQQPGQGQPNPPQPGQQPPVQRPDGQPQPPREGEPPTPPQQ